MRHILYLLLTTLKNFFDNFLISVQESGYKISSFLLGSSVEFVVKCHFSETYDINTSPFRLSSRSYFLSALLLTSILRALVSIYADDSTDYERAYQNQDVRSLLADLSSDRVLTVQSGKTGLKLSISQSLFLTEFYPVRMNYYSLNEDVLNAHQAQVCCRPQGVHRSKEVYLSPDPLNRSRGLSLFFYLGLCFRFLLKTTNSLSRLVAAFGFGGIIKLSIQGSIVIYPPLPHNPHFLLHSLIIISHPIL